MSPSSVVARSAGRNRGRSIMNTVLCLELMATFCVIISIENSHFPLLQSHPSRTGQGLRWVSQYVGKLGVTAVVVLSACS